MDNSNETWIYAARQFAADMRYAVELAAIEAAREWEMVKAEYEFAMIGA